MLHKRQSRFDPSFHRRVGINSVAGEHIGSAAAGGGCSKPARLLLAEDSSTPAEPN